MSNRLTVKQIDNLIKNFDRLTFLQQTEFKQYLTMAQIQTARNQVILKHQGQNSKKGLLILEGTVTLTKKMKIKQNSKNHLNNKNQASVKIAELTYPQIINIQSLIDRSEFCKYTATVSSREVKFIQISQSCMQMLYPLMQIAVCELQESRNRKLKKYKIEQYAKKQEQQNRKLIVKMSLPELKLPKRSLTTNNLHKNSNKGVYRSEDRNKSSKFNLVNIQSVMSAQKIRKPQFIHNLKNRQKTQNSSHLHRNQLIFKEQLKSIIKRKLIYERKQLAVLKAYKQQEKQKENIIKEDRRQIGASQRNQIDVYFQY